MRFSTSFLVGLILQPVAFTAAAVVVVEKNDADDHSPESLRGLRRKTIDLSVNKDTLEGALKRLVVNIGQKGSDFAERLADEQAQADFASFAFAPNENDMASIKENVAQLTKALGARNGFSDQHERRWVASSNLKSMVQTIHSTLEAEELSTPTSTNNSPHRHSRRLSTIGTLIEVVTGLATAIEAGDTEAFVSYMIVIKDALRTMIGNLVRRFQEGRAGGEEEVIEYADEEIDSAAVQDTVERVWIHLFRESNDYVDYFINEIDLEGTVLGGVVKTFLLPFYFTVVAFIYVATNFGFECVLSGSADCARIPFVEQQKWHDTAGAIAAASVERDGSA